MIDNPKRHVTMMALVTAVCLMGDSMLYIALPIYWRELGLASLWEVGILLSVNRFVRLPLSPLIGILYARMDKRWGLMISVILAFLTTTSYGLLSGFAWWVVLRCLWGVAWTFLRIGAYLTILDLSDERNRGALLGRYNGTYRLGSLVGMLAGGFFADMYGLRSVALTLGIIALISLPLVWKYSSVPSQTSTVLKTPKVKGSLQVKFLFKGPSNVLFMIVTGLLVSMICEGMFTATLSHLVSLHVSSIFVAGVVVGATTVSGLLQAMRWGWSPWLSPWFGRKMDRTKSHGRLISIVLIAAACCFAAIPLPLPFSVLLLFIVGILVSSTLLTTAIDTLVTNAASSSFKVTIITLYTLTLDVGAALGPILGYSVDINVAFGASALILFVLAGVWLVKFRSKQSEHMSAQ
ncbi:Predicted arabinose efflux permease, MFS family [Paenibacillus sp. 1_12]|uniref:MFS transporter n=1 Tax=Paenibacillus sp. 1_12 TaxID=1566278 RepID=UPI0008ED6107|nr:MFS transporter [Paenibacillus sp. 1_12]SFM30554.1 Predicted arabinose efflux permease, MFS family [Paenibacillus sp. 1_12]